MHAFSRDIAAEPPFADANFVDFVEKHNAIVLDLADRHPPAGGVGEVHEAQVDAADRRRVIVEQADRLEGRLEVGDQLLVPLPAEPAEDIHVIYRSDESGTTDNFQHYLDAASDGAWGKGTGKTFNGGVGRGGCLRLRAAKHTGEGGASWRGAGSASCS